MTRWEFDVAYSSHALLKQGVTEAGMVRVHVEADTHTEASLIAAGMAAIHGMPTAIYDRI